MKKEFLDLGKQPIANKFLKEDEISDEFFFDLKVVFDEDTKLVSMKDFVKPELMFNEDYKYNTSLSTPMVNHFKETAEMLKMKFKPRKVLEIGSNDGPFISNFDKDSSICVEPCDNFAKVTADMGYETSTEFWTTELSKKIKDNDGEMDLIYSANCICHIQDLDDCFGAVANLLSDKGVFVFEDPSLLRMLERGSYDQIYDEHAHVFSVTALDNLLKKNGLVMFDVDNLSVHGGSNRIFARLISDNPADESVDNNLLEEEEFGLNNFETYVAFGKRVEKSKEDLLEILHKAKSDGKKVMTIGATCKSSIVFNYCGIDSSLMECITDTTPDKQNLLAPGSHIPVVDRKDIDITEYDYAFLGAWNFIDYIQENETEFKGKTKFGKNVLIGDNVTFGSDCLIGHNTIIEQNVSIGDNCSIGSNVIIRNTLINNNVTILDNCVIGKHGFGFFPNNEKNLRYPHIGIVIIGENSEIGCGCTIDRGSMSNTVIGKNTFLDNQIHIAHNVKIGENSIIAGQVGIAGSSILGNNVRIGGQAGISGHLTIGNNVEIAGGSGVIKDISDNSKVMGYPAKNIRDFLKDNK